MIFFMFNYNNKAFMNKVNESILIKNLLNGRSVVQCNLAQSSNSDSQTCITRYELVGNEELYEFLNRAYEGCNYISSLEELGSLIDRTPYETLIELLNSSYVELWETTNTVTWETTSGWN